MVLLHPMIIYPLDRGEVVVTQIAQKRSLKANNFLIT